MTARFPSRDSPSLATNTTHFFRLSPELRNQIYELVLPKDQTIALYGAVFNTAAVRAEVKHIITLTQTCKQIRQETQQIFYANNDFVFYGFTAARLARFVVGVGRDALCSIRSLEFYWREIKVSLVGNCETEDAGGSNERTSTVTQKTVEGLTEPSIFRVLDAGRVDVKEVRSGAGRKVWYISPREARRYGRASRGHPDALKRAVVVDAE